MPKTKGSMILKDMSTVSQPNKFGVIVVEIVVEIVVVVVIFVGSRNLIRCANLCQAQLKLELELSFT